MCFSKTVNFIGSWWLYIGSSTLVCTIMEFLLVFYGNLQHTGCFICPWQWSTHVLSKKMRNNSYLYLLRADVIVAKNTVSSAVVMMQNNRLLICLLLVLLKVNWKTFYYHRCTEGLVKLVCLSGCKITYWWHMMNVYFP